MAIFLTITLIEIIVSGATSEAAGIRVLEEFGKQFGIGLVSGLAGGQLIILVINRLKLEAGLYPIVVLSLALCLFAATGIIGGSGFLAVFIAGVRAGNSKVHGLPLIRRFQDGMTWFCQIAMFLTLGLLAIALTVPQYRGAGGASRPVPDAHRATDRGLALPSSIRVQPQRDNFHLLGRAARGGVDPARRSCRSSPSCRPAGCSST